MSYGNGGAYPGSNAIAIIPDAAGPPDSWNFGGRNDQPSWATDDDYRAWNDEQSSDTVSNAASRAGSEQPPNKKSKNSSQVGDSRTTSSKAIGKMFFKTKLCCKFRGGTCPYITNCNFAHGVEELRRPPANWQEIVAAHGEGLEPREEHQIPTVNSSIAVEESERSYKARRCKKFYTEEGCPYGDSCTFIHDEQSKARESVAISLSPTVGLAAYAGVVNGSTQKPTNWKTRICNKWEMTGYCPFGSKCHFAHGTPELNRYTGGEGEGEGEGRESSVAPPDSKQVGIQSKTPADTVVASNTSLPHSDLYHIGAPSQRSTGIIQRLGQRSIEKWKGPDTISRIYGDWIGEAD